jgi:hypothetical protein
MNGHAWQRAEWLSEPDLHSEFSRRIASGAAAPIRVGAASAGAHKAGRHPSLHVMIEARPGVPGAGLLRLRQRGRTLRFGAALPTLSPQPIADSYLARYGYSRLLVFEALVETDLRDEHQERIVFRPK